MNLFYSLMGGVALASGKMSRFSINLIPSNWALIGGGFLAGFGALSSFALKREVPTLLIGLLLLLVGMLFLLSSLLRHTVFQPTSSSASVDSPPAAPQGSDEVMLYTGKLRLQEKVARRFLAVPVQLVTLENGEPAFASNIDASSSMYGIVTNARRGVWLSIPRSGSVQAEEGLFYHGFKGAPALRLRYTEELDGSQNTTVVAFASPAEREAVRSRLTGQKVPVAAGSPFSS